MLDWSISAPKPASWWRRGVEREGRIVWVRERGDPGSSSVPPRPPLFESNGGLFLIVESLPTIVNVWIPYRWLCVLATAYIGVWLPIINTLSQWIVVAATCKRAVRLLHGVIFYCFSSYLKCCELTICSLTWNMHGW